MKITIIIGARPNFVKAAPLIHQLRKHCTVLTIHTGQHYDKSMSGSFLSQMGIGKPDVQLDASGHQTHVSRLSYLVNRIGLVLQYQKPDACIVVGDVDSTLGGALAASLRGIPIVHLEAGLRSFNRKMPEERNRVLVDQMSSLLLTTEHSANVNLGSESVPGVIKFVGNTMIDSLYSMISMVDPDVIDKYGLKTGEYALATFHREELLSNKDDVLALLDALNTMPPKLSVVISCHPRLLAMVPESFRAKSQIQFLDPVPYNDFVALMDNARVVMTDSGGIQEETTALGIPCLTYRWDTERPVTVDLGTNRLVGVLPDKLVTMALETKHGRQKRKIPLWDGKAGVRAAKAIMEWINE